MRPLSVTVTLLPNTTKPHQTKPYQTSLKKAKERKSFQQFFNTRRRTALAETQEDEL